MASRPGGGSGGDAVVSRWGYPPVPAPGGALDPTPPLPASEVATYFGLGKQPPSQPASSSSAAAGIDASSATAIIAPGTPPAAPATPPPRRGGWGPFGGWGGKPRREQQPPSTAAAAPIDTALPPGVAVVAPPAIAPPPWVKSMWRGAAAGTVGVLRVDLRRPVFPWPEDCDESNLLFKRSAGAGAARRGRGRPALRPITAAANGAAGQYYDAGGRRPPTGARLKVMRCLRIDAPEGAARRRPLADLGLGVALDLDRQCLHGVARLKLGDLVSIKLAPAPVVKLGALWRLPGTGLALRFRYECPWSNLGDFWRPPARLMLRVDTDAGTGVHLSPTGIEFDERRLALGDSTEIRAGATLRFPRSLPVDRDDPDAFALQVHRLSLKTRW